MEFRREKWIEFFSSLRANSKSHDNLNSSTKWEEVS